MKLLYCLNNGVRDIGKEAARCCSKAYENGSTGKERWRVLDTNMVEREEARAKNERFTSSAQRLGQTPSKFPLFLINRR
ncbi:hypothetical protein L1987_70970 [Smallanthus sonchifolius]|uniref:Uncharacterized protein n=1 Tax=Smallanthus sonchifolius TaxID=185202 RepID=A0ACB9AQS5_9ASTR|nr:hypothetical protein L1987_70970 [Smallanthus sonchifolius]